MAMVRLKRCGGDDRTEAAFVVEGLVSEKRPFRLLASRFAEKIVVLFEQVVEKWKQPIDSGNVQSSKPPLRPPTSRVRKTRPRVQTRLRKGLFHGDS